MGDRMFKANGGLEVVPITEMRVTRSTIGPRRCPARSRSRRVNSGARFELEISVQISSWSRQAFLKFFLFPLWLQRSDSHIFHTFSTSALCRRRGILTAVQANCTQCSCSKAGYHRAHVNARRSSRSQCRTLASNTCRIFSFGMRQECSEVFQM